MNEYGDATPEDSWDPDDPLEELLDNIVRRIALLLLIDALTDHERQRLRMIADDLNHIIRRVRQLREGDD